MSNNKLINGKIYLNHQQKDQRVFHLLFNVWSRNGIKYARQEETDLEKRRDLPPDAVYTTATLSTLFSKAVTTNGWGTVKSLIEIWTDLVFYSSLLTFSLIFVTLTRAVPGPRTFSCNVFSNNMKSRDSLQFGGQGKIKRRLARLKLSLSNLLILTKWLFAKIPFAQTQQYVHCLRLNVISKCRLESLASSSGYISDQR